MARGTSLNELVRMVREEAGHSTNAALGQNTVEGIKNKIRRQQDILWAEHEWPHLRVEREIKLEAGSRYYDPPEDLSMNHRIDAVAIYYDGQWREVAPGITLAHYNLLDPDQDQRQDPVRAWEIYEGDQIEVWPLPATNYLRLRLRGTRNLRPLVANDDIADLDDRLIALFVAAEITARQNQRDAEIMVSQAQRLLQKLKANNSKNRMFRANNPSRYVNGPAAVHTGPRPKWGRPL